VNNSSSSNGLGGNNNVQKGNLIHIASISNFSKEAGIRTETADKKVKSLIGGNAVAINKDNMNNSSSNNRSLKNQNQKKLRGVITNNSDLTHANMSNFNKDSNEINDLKLSEEISNKDSDSVAGRADRSSAEIHKLRNRDMKKRRLVASTNRDTEKVRSSGSSLSKSKVIRESFTKLKRRRRLDETNDCIIKFYLFCCLFVIFLLIFEFYFYKS